MPGLKVEAGVKNNLLQGVDGIGECQVMYIGEPKTLPRLTEGRGLPHKQVTEGGEEIRRALSAN